MSFFKVNTTRDVVINAVVAIAIFLALVSSFFLFWLPYTTNHGEAIVVPELQGHSVASIAGTLEAKSLRYQIYDSVYRPGSTPMTVLTQYPRSGTTVKSNRKIYITVTAINPPQVKMPNLVDASLLNAQMVLQSYGLKLGTVTKVPHFAENAVLKQMVGGQDIKSGTMISKGSAVDLVVGNGLSNIEVDIPNLVGMESVDAKMLLQSNNLEVGVVLYDDKSREDAGKVVKQKPAFVAGEKIKQGQAVDIWIAGENPGKVVLDEDE